MSYDMVYAPCAYCKLLVYLSIDFHGKDGRIYVSDMTSTLLADKFILAGQEMGFEHVDANAKKQIGTMTFLHCLWRSFR